MRPIDLLRPIDGGSIRAGLAIVQAIGLALAGLASLAGGALAADATGAVARSESTVIVASAEQSQSAPSAAAGAGFEIRWQTINGGATLATGGDYQLRGTVGQADADPAHPAQSADFAHTGGFWMVLPGAGDVVRIVIFGDRFEG